MDNNRVLSALCYFSILFAPFLLPIIVYFVTHDGEVKHHAKRSLLSHIIPVVLMIVVIILSISTTISQTMSYSYSMDYFAPEPPNFFLTAGLPILFMILYLVVSLVVMIWNIVQGVKVLR